MKMGPLHSLFDLPRTQKRLLQVAADTVLLTLSFGLAMTLRTESLAFLSDPSVWAALVAALPVTLILFVKLGFYRAVIRYMGLKALATILNGVVASAIVLSGMTLWLGLPVPAAVPALYAILALCTVGGVRFALRAIYQRTIRREKTRVIIYGAGQSGRQTAHSLWHGLDHAPVAFVDDNPELWGSQIAGLRIFPPSDLARLIRHEGARVLLLAMPSLTRAARAEILRRLEHLPVRVQTIPGMSELVTGKHQVSEITEVTVEDLLGRDPVPPDPGLMSATIRGKSVLVTGAGGSIGAELCRQILRQKPRVLVLSDQSEYALFEIAEELETARKAAGLDVTSMCRWSRTTPSKGWPTTSSARWPARRRRWRRGWKASPWCPPTRRCARPVSWGRRNGWPNWSARRSRAGRG